MRTLRDRLRRYPVAFTAVVSAGQIVIIIIAILWLQVLLGYLGMPRVSERSPRSAPLVYAAMAMVLIGLGVELFVRRFRIRLGMITAAFVMTLIVVSNQFLVIYKLGDGQVDKEFRMLADWYLENAKPGEKLVTTLPQIVSLYDQSVEPYLVRTSSLEGETLDDVIRRLLSKEHHLPGMGFANRAIQEGCVLPQVADGSDRRTANRAGLRAARIRHPAQTHRSTVHQHLPPPASIGPAADRNIRRSAALP